MDLWSGEVNCVSSREQGDKVYFNLYLPKFESRLIMLGDEIFPLEIKKEFVDVEFEIISEDKEKFVKTYSGKYCGKRDNLYVSVLAEEMVECFVNGEFCGVSLWNKHEFYLSPYLIDGENLIELVITGNAANRFTANRISYGLIK